MKCLKKFKRDIPALVFSLFSWFFLALALVLQWKITRIARSRCSSGEFSHLISTYSWNSHRCNVLIVNIQLFGKCLRNRIFITNMNNEHWTVQTTVAKCKFIAKKYQIIFSFHFSNSLFRKKKNGFSWNTNASMYCVYLFTIYVSLSYITCVSTISIPLH